jgi:hypothetical protein
LEEEAEEEEELNELGLRDVWREGGDNNNSVWREVSKMCVDIK